MPSSRIPPLGKESTSASQLSMHRTALPTSFSSRRRTTTTSAAPSSRYPAPYPPAKRDHPGSYSVTSSSHPSRQRRLNTTTSGRKSTASSIWGSASHYVFCAIAEARGISPSVGLAFVNISTNEAIMCQICDTQFYVKTIHKLQMYEPSTILVVNTTLPPNPKSTLLSIIEEEFPDTTIEGLDRKYWSEHAGLGFIQTLAFQHDIEAIKVAIDGNFYATCSFAAVIKYLETACRVSITASSLRIRYQPSENTMMIDISTVHSLELIQNLQDGRSKDCLFGLLNNCITPMGSRMLRSNILQPSTQVETTLLPRYDALDEITVKEDMFFEIRKALKDFSDVEKCLTSIVIIPQEASIYATESALDSVLRVKAFVIAIPALHESLGSARSDLLKKICELCRSEVTQPVLDLITETINEDVTAMKTPIDMRNQRTYAVKSGVDGLLDVARKTYKEATEDVYELVEAVNSEHNIKAEIKFDNHRKFWLRLKEDDFEDRPLPDIFINMVVKKKWIECQTLSLVQYNNRITDSHNEAVMMSDKVIQQLLDGIRSHVPNLFRICEGIALLDMIMSFAHSATTMDYVRPEISDTLALKGARHPIRERLNPERFIPNDVYSSEPHRFQIITGCNMSGKSTYVRMITLLQVMAQVGSFVPAEYAAFPIIQQLFVRMNTDDSIESNLSSFSLEMREMAFILRNVNNKSLTIIDELGRGTSPRDGLAIALAISEALVESNSMVWFVTHFEELARILNNRPGVLNIHLATDISNISQDQIRMTMLYKIKSGPLQEKNYGLHLARTVGFPEQLVLKAQEVSQRLADDAKSRMMTSESRRLLRRRKLVLHLTETLHQLKDSKMDDAALGSYLKRLQDEFAHKLESTIEG
ncbi:DNA mismatch repair protein-like protein MutS [Xylariaceae sp. FL0255]|nr:DNA mismatch repair protein-like protein MutS [Xylariaceae sp. FL0255]